MTSIPSSQNLEDRRLWIGNLDSHLTEYQLLKIVQKCGKIEKFDMLFHKSGPHIGTPRGYAFVTYESVKEALTAIDKLNGVAAGCKHLVVRLAKNINYDDFEKPKPRIEIPVLAAGSSKETKFSKEGAIRAIEAKLKALETRRDDMEINRSATDEVPLIRKYQFNKNGEASANKPYSSRYQYVKHKSSGPYNRNQRPRR